MQSVIVLGVILTIHLHCTKANLSLDFKVTKITASPANCNVANTTYAHGETFKLDCKTQCVCENGRHACSSLCPKEQLPAPEDTISCRSPRLVEVPGHCCKMWLCENPTADVYATCHNTSTSPWTPCSQPCGLGISTRFTSTAAGCNQLTNLRLCENRRCDSETDLDNNDRNDNNNEIMDDGLAEGYDKYLTNEKTLLNLRRHKKNDGFHRNPHQEHYKHKMKRGHECHHVEHLGPARIRLGQCVSRKLYRPKVCGHCFHKTKCCVPSVSTTIQVELLCPLNAADPISLLQQQLNEEYMQQKQQLMQQLPIEEQQQEIDNASNLESLWDMHTLDGIDQEYFQSHQIHIENKFIAIEWILKCTCSESDSCQRSVMSATHRVGGSSSSNSNDSPANTSDNDTDESFYNINMQNGNNNNNKSKKQNQNNSDNNDDYNYFGLYGKINKSNYKRQHLQHIDDNTTDDNDDSNGGIGDGNTSINNSNGHYVQTKNHNGRAINAEEKAKHWPASSISSLASLSASSPSLPANSDEIQPDIIPYPPPPFTANKQTNIGNQKHVGNNRKNFKNEQLLLDQTAKSINEKFKIERQREREQEREQQQAQQQQYFYEQWLLQQQQQERQQAYFDQLMGT